MRDMESEVTPFDALKEAVQRKGSQSAFARFCGISQTAVWKWLQNGKHLPAEYVLPVERETGVSRHLLRPDLYPVEATRAPPSSHHEQTLAGSRLPVACDRTALSHSGSPR